jgi:hypothetical protein
MQIVFLSLSHQAIHPKTFVIPLLAGASSIAPYSWPAYLRGGQG